MVKISIVTICFNAEKEIARTIKSVLEQTFEDYEYIVVDGKSTDSTLEVINQIMANYPTKNVRIISEPDKGIYDAMNKGIKSAKGEWINMMNAGDTFVDEHVLASIFKQTIPEHISFLYSDFYKSTSFGRYFRVKKQCGEHSRSFVHQSVIYRKRLHNEYGYYIVTPKIIISDFLFFLQMPLEQIMKVDTVIAKYEGNGISESGSWCTQQGLCANVVYRHKNFWHIYIDFIKWKLKHLVPLKLREYYRLKTSEVL